MTVVVRLSADEVKLIRSGLDAILIARTWPGADASGPIWRRLDEMALSMSRIVEKSTGLIRLGARDLVALQFAVRVGREMRHYNPKRRKMGPQPERAAAALMAKFEQYRKRLHRRDKITTPCWQHPAYKGWYKFRTFVRGTHSFGRRITIRGIPLSPRWISLARLKRMRRLVEQYGPDIFDRVERGEFNVVAA